MSEVVATNADFGHADLAGADLRRGEFSKAFFLGANLTEARFEGAHLDGANLATADFSGVKDWEFISSIRCANIYGMIAPYEFKKWALANGALEYDRYHWDEWLEARDACLVQDVDEADSTGNIP